MCYFRKILLACFLLAPLWLYGQTDSLRFSVRGVVRDATSGRVLPEVGVSVPGTSYATVTNSEGTFIIKSSSPVSKLEFSMIGYERLTQDAPASENAVMGVRLKPKNLTLDPALVLYGSPLDIMRLAMSKISENSPSGEELFDCFYRETVRKRQRFIYVSEAVTKMYKPAQRDLFSSDRVAVRKSRLLTSTRVSDTLGVKVIGGPAMPVTLDLTRSRRMILDELELGLYNLEMLPPQSLDGRTQFVIRLTPAATVEEALQNGVVYIDRETLAFSRIELSLDVTDKDKATRAMLVKRPTGLRFKPKEMSLLLNYKMEEGKSRLSYLKTVFRFDCDWKRRLLATDFTVVAEMVVTKRYDSSEVTKIPRSEAFSDRESLSDKTKEYLDPDFWKDYNIIEPTVGLEHAVNRLKVNP